MTEEFKPTAPDYKGDGVAIWKATTREGKPYLKVKLLGSITLNCFKNEPRMSTADKI